jgi:hypothetical protein
MDPDATFSELMDAIERRDREHVAMCADALLGWIDMGGFMPSGIVNEWHTDKQGAVIILNAMIALTESE